MTYSSNQALDYDTWLERVDQISRKHVCLPASEFEPDLRPMFDAGTTPEGFVLVMIEEFDLIDACENPWTGQGGLKELGK